MNVYKAFCGLLSVGVFIIGCGQDPFGDDQVPIDNGDNGIVNAEDPRKKIKEDLSYIPPDAVFLESISGADEFVFVEGKPNSVEFRGRIAYNHEDKGLITFPMTMKVDHLPQNDDGSSAIFERDGDIYRFVWTPPKNLIRGKSIFRSLPLKVAILSVGKPAIRKDYQFNLHVQRDLPGPKIVNVTIDQKPIFEGEVKRFVVEVEDEDSLDDGSLEPEELRAPKLKIFSANKSGKNIGHLVRFDAKGPENIEGTNRWQFNLAVDTNHRELTHSKEDFYFGLEAISRFGINSAPYEGKVTIKNQVTAPIVTMTSDDILVQVGHQIEWAFDVYSPKAIIRKQSSGKPKLVHEEKVEVEYECSMKSANCKCVSLKEDYPRYHCSLSWVPQMSDVGDQSFYIKAWVTNEEDPKDVKETIVKKYFKVVAGVPASKGVKK